VSIDYHLLFIVSPCIALRAPSNISSLLGFGEVPSKVLVCDRNWPFENIRWETVEQRGGSEVFDLKVELSRSTGSISITVELLQFSLAMVSAKLYDSGWDTLETVFSAMRCSFPAPPFQNFGCHTKGAASFHARYSTSSPIMMDTPPCDLQMDLSVRSGRSFRFCE
jgi:hypothetical protein